ELLCGEALDARRRCCARELRGQLGVLRPQVGPFAAEVVELHVQAQDGDVRRDHACEESRDNRDPEDPAGDTALAPNSAGSRARRNRNSFLSSDGGPCGHYVFTPTRSRTDEERGFAALSIAFGRIALRESDRSSGRLPQTQIGK